MKQSERIQFFVDEIWAWYARHKRSLPWRDLPDTDDTQRAYKILVSEIMLQQTQVPRVIIIYRRFLQQFPTLQSLANASNKDVIIAWKGMGYNSRALRLRDAARIIINEHAGIFPKKFEDLLSIKGIGPYTAAAIRNFAFNIPTPCIDTNIRRILHRTFVGPENEDGTWEMNDRELIKIAEEVLNVAVIPPPLALRGVPSLLTPPPTEGGGQKEKYFEKPLPPSGERVGLGGMNRTSSAWHAALMDFGSIVQTKSNVKWDICPLTAKGLMKAKPHQFKKLLTANRPSDRIRAGKLKTKTEPGRMEGAKYVPNRIFRGRIVDALRDHPNGLTLERLGSNICMDWKSSKHKIWLKNLIKKLEQDRLLTERNKRFVLQD